MKDLCKPKATGDVVRARERLFLSISSDRSMIGYLGIAFVVKLL
jgi:hypothetical protein